MPLETDLSHFVSAFRSDLVRASDAALNGNFDGLEQIAERIGKSETAKAIATRISTDTSYRDVFLQKSQLGAEIGFGNDARTKQNFVKTFTGGIVVIVGAIVAIEASTALAVLFGLLLIALGVMIIGDKLKNAIGSLWQQVAGKMQGIGV